MSEIAPWEYRVLSVGSAWRGPRDEVLEEALNELGAEGWEVISVLAHDYGGGKVRVVAKRPLTDRARRRRSLPQ
ncbi:MAG: DUF4177 domain-containing protein [Anaerolineales bacterium]|nr:DUF4177 domain-containing protein [Anaerolineales bacterium]MCS7248678.1 DUF4177 domain-containing protein [Anaerolineales bacterium]MDW8162491.1 DUF4177 domain-containing protein [Anaerolineales bacterium]MDW8445916.1 DUF4177 domain-containing protein [Anaerolineales bacterium]